MNCEFRKTSIVLVVLDSAGIGELPDASMYNDKGANTIGHVFDSMGESYLLPNMAKLGLYKILNTKNNLPDTNVVGCYGKMMTKSPAKDTTAGHWEMAGWKKAKTKTNKNKQENYVKKSQKNCKKTNRQKSCLFLVQL